MNKCGALPKKLIRACERGKLLELAEEYAAECYEGCAQSDGKKARRRFPNLAGFCRRLGIGTEQIKLLRSEYPEQYGALLSLLEDEALNSSQSATVLTAYMKEHLDFGEKKEGGASFMSGDIKLVFEHDILEDGE